MLREAFKERLTLAAAIAGIGVLFSLSCLFENKLVDLYSHVLIPDLADLIPAAIARYKIWLIGTTIVFAVFSDKLLIGLSAFSFRKRLLAVAFFSAILNVLIIYRSWQFPYCIDDAYIIFRYADNMLRFGMPDFDIGSHVNTISSQLQFLLLVAVAAATGQRNLPVVSQSINLAQEIASLFVLFAIVLGGFKSLRLALYACALHAVSAYAIMEVTRGKEGSAVILLLYLLIWAQLSSRRKLGVWISSLMCILRPEGGLVFLASLVSDVKRNKGNLRSLITWLKPMVLVASVFVAIFWFYGTVVPQGVLAKSLIYHVPALVCVRSIVAQLLASLVGIPFFIPPLESILIFLAFYAIFASLLWRYEFLRLYLVSLVLVSIFFIMGNAPMNAFPWYLSWWAPLLPFTYVGIIEFIGRFHFQERSDRFLKFVVGAFSLVIVPGHSYYWTPFATIHAPLPIFYWDNITDRLRIYEVAREYLNKHAKKTDTLAVVEVGVISYGYDGKIFDLLGLVSPDALKLYPVPSHQHAPCGLSIPPRYAALYKPERMLFLDCFARNGLLKDEYFKRNYQLEWFWKNDSFDSAGVYLYKRMPARESQSGSGT